jgi:hypothetical protein
MKNNVYYATELFSPEYNPYEVTFEEWTARWWQWLLSIPKTESPLFDDPDGKKCSKNQSGPVWYLPGTLGGSAERSCTVPSGKAILLPVLNVECSFAEGDGTTEEQLRSNVMTEMDKITRIEVSINDQKIDLAENRIQSLPFDAFLPKNNVLGVQDGTTRMVSDGYWLFLKPPKRGRYNIHSFGSCLAGTIKIDLTYHLTIGKLINI